MDTRTNKRVHVFGEGACTHTIMHSCTCTRDIHRHAHIYMQTYMHIHTHSYIPTGNTRGERDMYGEHVTGKYNYREHPDGKEGWV